MILDSIYSAYSRVYDTCVNNSTSFFIIQCCDISVTYVVRKETSSIELLQLYKKNIIRAINMLLSLYGITFWLTNYICVQVSDWFVSKDGCSCFRFTENFRRLCKYWTDFVKVDTKQILNVFYIQVHMYMYIFLEELKYSIFFYLFLKYWFCSVFLSWD